MLADAWRTRRGDIDRAAGEITEHLQDVGQLEGTTTLAHNHRRTKHDHEADRRLDGADTWAAATSTSTPEPSPE
jgi:hypothetical protein